MRIADRIVFLDQGKILFEGTLQSALKSPLPPLNAFFETGRGKHT
jgi:phospholipid/cholesterol/gamma-HCH transport system ATP-binding protein